MNIPGIKVLHQTEILDSCLNPTALTVMAVALIIAVLTFFLAWALEDSDILPIVSVLAVSVAFFAFIGSAIFEIETPTGRYEYEVLIDDTVDLKTVYNQYEIVCTRGEIYILREREATPDSPGNTSEESSSTVCKKCQSSFDKKFNFCPQCGDETAEE